MGEVISNLLNIFVQNDNKTRTMRDVKMSNITLSKIYLDVKNYDHSHNERTCHIKEYYSSKDSLLLK